MSATPISRGSIIKVRASGEPYDPYFPPPRATVRVLPADVLRKIVASADRQRAVNKGRDAFPVTISGNLIKLAKRSLK